MTRRLPLLAGNKATHIVIVNGFLSLCWQTCKSCVLFTNEQMYSIFILFSRASHAVRKYYIYVPFCSENWIAPNESKLGRDLNYMTWVKMENQLWSKVFHAVTGRNTNELKDIFSNCKVTDKMCTDVKSGDTALHLVCKLGDLEILRFLVEVCVDSLEDLEAVNFDRRTCLHEAVTACNISVVKYLLEKGAAVDAVKRGEWTPLMLACANSGTSSYEIVNLLLRFGANTKARNKDGWTPVNLAVRLGDESKIELLASVDKDALQIKTNNKRTILHTAALHGRASVLQFLLSSECGCSGMLSCTDVCGVSPFLDAATSGSLETVKVILSHYDALGDRDKKGLSALHHAARTGSVSVIKFLVEELGADVNTASDIDRVTPLHVAAREKQGDVVDLLMKLGADTSLTDAHGRNVWDYSTVHVT